MALPYITHPQFDDSKLKAKGVSLVAFFDSVRIRKEGKGTVKLRVVYKRYPKYYTTKVSTTEEEYLKICSDEKGKTIKDKRIIIYENLNKAYDIINSMNTFSFEEFDRKFKNKSKTNNIFTYLNNYIEELKKEGRMGSVTAYTSAQNKLKELHPNEKLPFESMTVQFFQKFEKWMLAAGSSPTTVGFYCRSYKKMFNDAIRDEIVPNSIYPFGDTKRGLYQPPQPRNIKKAIPLSAIQKIVEYQPEERSPEQYYKDLWIFSYLSNGINIKDICLLQYKHIENNSIIFKRAKTINTSRKSKPIQITLIDQNRAIIERWGNKPATSNQYIFPVFTEGLTPKEQQAKIRQLTKQVNKYIKSISEKLKLNLKVTTYTARHSYATVLKRSGVGIEYISESLGHSDLKVTENYLDSFEDETRVANTKKLLEF